MLQAPTLAALAGIRHAFFTRDGGVSDGIYASLNGGPGSEDAPANVAENRARMAAMLGVRPDRFLTAYQIHSPDVVTVERPWSAHERPRADAIVTRTPGLAIGVTTADCGPVLLADQQAGVIGAAHAGWRGAATGMLEATIAAMERCGADRARMVAALGPMIRQPNYEVGPELVARFTAEDATNARFFQPSPRPDHALFDLPGYIAARLARAGVARVEDRRPLHLWRSRALLQLPPVDPPPGARLRASHQCHSAGKLASRSPAAAGHGRRNTYSIPRTLGRRPGGWIRIAEPTGKSMRTGLGLPSTRAKAPAKGRCFGGVARAGAGTGGLGLRRERSARKSHRDRAALDCLRVDRWSRLPPLSRRFVTMLKDEAAQHQITVGSPGEVNYRLRGYLAAQSDRPGTGECARLLLRKRLRSLGHWTSMTATSTGSFA